jgi:hypothetical protein
VSGPVAASYWAGVDLRLSSAGPRVNLGKTSLGCRALPVRSKWETLSSVELSIQKQLTHCFFWKYTPTFMFNEQERNVNRKKKATDKWGTKFILFLRGMGNSVGTSGFCN